MKNKNESQKNYVPKDKYAVLEELEVVIPDSSSRNLIGRLCCLLIHEVSKYRR